MIELSKINKQIEGNLLVVFLVLILITESYSKIQFITTGNSSEIPKIIKGIISVYMVFMIVKHNFKSKFVKYGVILCCFFLIGQLSITEGLMYVNILAFFKYVFPIVLFIYFSKFPIQNKNKLFRVFEAIIIFNCLLIVVGFVFGVPYFKTYLGPRFGYNGLLYSSSLTSYVYIIVLFYFLMKYKIHFFSNWKTLLVIISALLVGTKTIYLALLFISILYLVNYSQFKYKYALAMLIPIVGILAGYFLFFKWGFFNELRQSEGVFSSILSFRNQLFLNDTLPYIKENWSWINYCFGGVADFRTKSEMGFIDVFYFFGTMGGAVFLYTYWRSFFTFSPIRLVWIFSGFLGIIIFISGNYFIYTTIPLFLVVLREKLMLKT